MFRVDELPRMLHLLRFSGPVQLLMLNPFCNATVGPVLVGLESCSALVGLRHLVHGLLPTRMAMGQATSCLAVPLHMLALPAAGVVVGILSQV